MAKSIAQQVAEYLREHPAATNADLYRMFPKVRENTLRNYKYKFKNSVDEFRNNRRKARSSRRKDYSLTADGQSLRKKVFDFFQENPKATNQKLYEVFSDYSKNKLRHYKSSFFKTIAPQSTVSETSRATAGKRRSVANKQQKSLTLATRVARLEKQVAFLNEQMAEQFEKPEGKSTFSDTASGIEKKIKELEETLAGFINARRKKIKTEMANLEEIQQFVSEKISSFIKGFK